VITLYLHLFYHIFLALIVYRILKVRSNFEKPEGQIFNPSPPTNLAIVYIICGLLYTLGIIIHLGLYLACHNGQYVVSIAVRLKA